MKNNILCISAIALMMTGVSLHAYSENPFLSNKEALGENLNNQLLELEPNAPQLRNFEKVQDVAQYMHADWSQAVGIMHHVTLSDALEFAESNPEIDYFFYVKNPMFLGSFNEEHRTFKQGDAVFFKGTPYWGFAEGFSDGYVKKRE
jgi:hypothetical protein